MVVTWILLGAALLGVLILALAARPVLVRLGRLRRAVLLLLRRQADAEALQATALRLQERALAMQGQLELAQRRAELIRARRRSAD